MAFVVNDLPDVSPSDYTHPSAYRFALSVRELLQTRCGFRGPTEEQMVLRRELSGVGLIAFDQGGQGGRTPIRLPPGGLPGTGPTEPDFSPPDTITGFTVTTLVAGAFLQWNPPDYTQGGGNSITEIFEAVYSGSGPLPTFGLATKIGSVPFGTEVFVAGGEPGTQRHYWVRAVTSYDVTQATPTGGVNGVSVVIGRIDGAEHIAALSIGTGLIGNLAVTDAKIASLSVSKLIAGTLQVGSYICSSNFESGVQGFYIGGDGTIEVSNGTFRGYISAGAGLIGGVIIDTVWLESENYVPGVSGFRLDAATGTIHAMDYMLKERSIITAMLADDSVTAKAGGRAEIVADTISTGATSKTIPSTTLVTLTVGDRPVTMQMYVSLYCYIVNSAVTQFRVTFEMRDQTGATRDSIQHYYSAQSDVSSTRAVNCRVPLFDWDTFTPGPLSMKYRVTIEWLDDSNAAQAAGAGSGYTLRVVGAVQENKV